MVGQGSAAPSIVTTTISWTEKLKGVVGRYNAGRYWCNQCRISGDIVSYLMDFRGHSYPDVLDFIEGKPVTPSGIPVKEREVVELNHRWVNSSLQFVVQCNQRLNREVGSGPILIVKTTSSLFLLTSHFLLFLERYQAWHFGYSNVKMSSLTLLQLLQHYYNNTIAIKN